MLQLAHDQSASRIGLGGIGDQDRFALAWWTLHDSGRVEMSFDMSALDPATMFLLRRGRRCRGHKKARHKDRNPRMLPRHCSPWWLCRGRVD
jgi:hypothetical protein